jgi:PAS domain S-box-containing protein
MIVNMMPRAYRWAGMQCEALLNLITAPLLRLCPLGDITYQNTAAVELLGHVRGTPFTKLLPVTTRDQQLAALMAGQDIECELNGKELPIMARLSRRPLDDGNALITITSLEERELLAGLSQILGSGGIGSGGDIEVLFARLAPFLYDRIPYSKCSLALWHEETQQLEIHTRHQDDTEHQDQHGELCDPPSPESIEKLRERHTLLLENEFTAAGTQGLHSCRLPLHYQRRYFGSLDLLRDQAVPFSERELKLLGTLLGPLSLGIAIAISIRELQARENSYRERYEEAPLMYHLIDARGCIIDVNRREAEMLGYTKEELTGKPLSMVLTEASQEQLELALAEYQRTRKLAFQGEREFVRKDGSIMHARLSSTVQYDNAGLLSCVRTIVHDITAQKKLQQRRLQAQKLESLGRMIAGITHELNNLLGPILGYAQILQRRLTNGANRELGHIEAAAQKARTILASLLHFARQSRPHKRYQDIVEVLNNTIKLVDNRAARRRVTLEISIPEPVPWTRCDETQMTQLFLNLINNAIEAFAGRPGKIKMSVVAQGPWLQISVRDNAGGIDEAIIPNLFDPFFSARADGTGSGLGLATCFGIVADHGGSIEASNGTLDGHPGAKFEILLPIRKRPTVNFKRQFTDRSEIYPDLRGRRVLVVEDDESYNRLVCQLLEDLGANVTEVRDGSEGRERIENSPSSPWDLIVADIRLPRMDGTELYRWITRNKPSMSERVLFITGDTLDEATRTFTDNAGIAPVTKPFEIQEFYRRISQMLS